MTPCGGGLAVAQAMRLREAGAEQPAGLILVSPWVDATVSNPEIEEYRSVDHMLDTGGRARPAAGGPEPAR